MLRGFVRLLPRSFLTNDKMNGNISVVNVLRFSSQRLLLKEYYRDRNTNRSTSYDKLMREIFMNTVMPSK